MLQKNLAIIRKPAPQMMLQLLRHCPFSVNYVWLSIKRWQIKSSGCWQSEEYEWQIFPKSGGRFQSGKVAWLHFPEEIFGEWKFHFFSQENLPGKSRYTYMLSLADHPKAWFSLTRNIFTLFIFYKQKVCLIHLGPAPRAKNPPSVAKLLRTWFLCRIRDILFTPFLIWSS